MIQMKLFDSQSDESVNIKEAATYLSVSTATIRNWIKSNQIHTTGKNKVLKSSIYEFYSQNKNSHKLSSRANKSQKDFHNHSSLTSDIKFKLYNEIDDPNLLGYKYENSLSDSYRNKEGIYYTPEHIVNDLFNIEDIGNATFCDPCCGSGNFIIRALELGFKAENIFAYDIDPIAIEITKKRFFNKTGIHSKNIICQDFLTINHNDLKFDYIYTNPPWGKKLEHNKKEKISKWLGIKKSDSFVLFFYACLLSLKDGGNLGLLLPESFFNISSYEDIRKKALSLNIKELKDYGKVFKGLQTNAVGIILSKKLSDGSAIKCKVNDKEFNRSLSSFIKNPKYIFNIHCNEEECDLIEHILSVPHITLENNAKWALGIVTGDNKKYVHSSEKNNYVPIYRGTDITEKGLNKASNFIDPSDLQSFQQVADLDYYLANEKLIYKFISSSLCFCYDTKQSFPLNSANVVITNNDFPVKMATLADLFNSSFMNWFFKMLFNTHKVLRSDIEKLPIHYQFLQDEFNEEYYLSSLNIEKTKNGTFRIKR